MPAALLLTTVMILAFGLAHAKAPATPGHTSGRNCHIDIPEI